MVFEIGDAETDYDVVTVYVYRHAASLWSLQQRYLAGDVKQSWRPRMVKLAFRRGFVQLRFRKVRSRANRNLQASTLGFTLTLTGLNWAQIAASIRRPMAMSRLLSWEALEPPLEATER